MIYSVIGLQYGSEAKGNIAGHLALERYHPDVIIHNWSPNAGHTLILPNGRKMVHSMMPMSIVSPAVRKILLGPGSVIDTGKLVSEMDSLRDFIEANNIEIIIHPRAAVVIAGNVGDEQKYIRIGSTMKGSAQAAISRMDRDPENMNIAGEVYKDMKWPIEGVVTIDADVYDQAIRDADTICIEGCQGYSLSMYHGQYPYTTSRDTSMSQLVADCGLPFGSKVHVIGVCRTYPIRVANRYNAEGEQIGSSGPCYPDQKETSWEELGLKTEYTTVTQLPRRVFSFSDRQIAEAAWRNGVNEVALTFCDYLTNGQVTDLVLRIEEATGSPVQLMSFGPVVTDVKYYDGLSITPEVVGVLRGE